VDGVLVVDKPAGPTSHDLVERVRHTLETRRVGHTGTLDPFATGVLPLCVGKATRLARFLSGGEKHYRACVRLGFATSTDDATGDPLSPPREVRLARVLVERVLAGLVGSFDQIPPAFSARHVGGKRLYELARRGEMPARAATRVTVYALDLVAFSGDTLEIEVRCSAGTYIRALARDLGEVLEVGAHLTALRRTRSGAFDLSQSVPGNDLRDAVRRLIPLDGLLLELPAVRLSEEASLFVRHGRDLDPELVGDAFPPKAIERVRLLDASGAFVALAVCRGFGDEMSELPRFPVLHPDVVLVE
jgi:tRNA pseudouridine55 synthase